MSKVELIAQWLHAWHSTAQHEQARFFCHWEIDAHEKVYCALVDFRKKAYMTLIGFHYEMLFINMNLKFPERIKGAIRKKEKIV